MPCSRTRTIESAIWQRIARGDGAGQMRMSGGCFLRDPDWQINPDNKRAFFVKKATIGACLCAYRTEPKLKRILLVNRFVDWE
jgi:hypothetical protein